MLVSLILCLVEVSFAEQMLPVTVNNRWPGNEAGYQGYLTLHVDKPIHGWQARLVFDRPISRIFIWEGIELSNNGNQEWLIGPVDYNTDLKPGTEIQVWFNAYGAQYVGARYSFETFAPPTTTTQSTVKTTTTQSTVKTTTTHSTLQTTTTQSTLKTTTTQSTLKTTTTQSTVKTTPSGDSLMKYNYSEALGLSILFYDAQRSGRLPPDNPILWRGDSAVNDSDDGRDLSGGWYDGGDHVKFNFPMSFSTWVLEWGMLKFMDGYKAAGQLDQACDMIRWPLEYFLKCWIPEENTLYVQVGEGHKDHAYWGRPENMTMERAVYKVTPSCKGSDVSAGIVSALAAGYFVFSNVCSDTVFAKKLLTSASSLYTFAMKHRGLYSDCVKEAKDFYWSDGDEDDLSVAAAWMYKATQEDIYLNDSIRLYPSAIPWDFSWNDVTSAAALLLYEETKSDAYKNDIDAFVSSYLPNGTVLQTPCGMAWLDQWGPNRYAANAALIALMASENGIHPERYKTWAVSQINHLLGDNKMNMSYEIGFQNTYPRNPHHRGSSCSATSNKCSIGDNGTNPNILVGALVGGPDVNGYFKDSRLNYVQTEVACDFNAGFQSALAGLRHFAHNNDIPRAPPSKC